MSLFFIRILETKVAVGGLLVHNREHVKTSPIVNRLDIRKVVTEDGVEVTLEGTIDKETSIANGFPPGIVQCLCAGKFLQRTVCMRFVQSVLWSIIYSFFVVAIACSYRVGICAVPL